MFKKLIIVLSILLVSASIVGAGTYTSNGLYKPGQNETSWGDLVNTNSDILDATIDDVNGLVSGGSGIVIDPDNYANLTAAIAVCSDAKMVISTEQTLDANTTFPADCSLEIIEGGSLTKASTYTLAINGNFEVGSNIVFIGFSIGDVTGLSKTNPTWWGSSGINSAVAANSSQTLTVSDAQTLTANLTVPAGVSLNITETGSITKVSTYTIAIQGDFHAVKSQVFINFSSGNITFTKNTIIRSEWWDNLTIAIGSCTDHTLLLDSPITLDANTSIPVGCFTEVKQGGSFVKASTYTLGILGGLDAGKYKIFDSFDTTDVIFGVGMTAIPDYWTLNATAGTTDMTTACQSAIDAVSPNGGTVFFPGTYLVVKDSPSGGGGANPDDMALHLEASNVTLQGIKGVSKIEGNDRYLLLRVGEIPIVNGSVNLSDIVIDGIEFDGNYTVNPAVADDGFYLLWFHGVKRGRISNSFFHHSSDYGIGFQNGGLIDMVVENVVVEDTAADGIDVKNNGNTTTGNKMNNITIRRAGGGDNGAAPYAGIDLMGLGWTLTNIFIEDVGTSGDLGAGVRFKQGESGDSRGKGAHDSSLANFYVLGASGGDTDMACVKVSAYNVSVTNGYVEGCPDSGILIEQQEVRVSNVMAKANGDGFLTEDSTYLTNGDRAQFSNCIARSNTARGFRIETDNVLISDSISRSNDIGLSFSGDLGGIYLGGEISANVSLATEGVDGSVNNKVIQVNNFTDTVASATTTTLPVSGDYFNITGTTNITSVTASWDGRIVTFKFSGILTFTDGSNLKLAGNFVTSSDDVISLACDGVNWYEISRSVN